MRVYHDFMMVPGSRSTLPDADPDPDPAKWYGSDRIRIRNTDYINSNLNVELHLNVVLKVLMVVE